MSGNDRLVDCTYGPEEEASASFQGYISSMMRMPVRYTMHTRELLSDWKLHHII